MPAVAKIDTSPFQIPYPGDLAEIISKASYQYMIVIQLSRC